MTPDDTSGLALSSLEVVKTQGALCRIVGHRGKDMSLQEIEDAHALACELHQPVPNLDRVNLLMARLGLGWKDVEDAREEGLDGSP